MYNWQKYTDIILKAISKYHQIKICTKLETHKKTAFINHDDTKTID